MQFWFSVVAKPIWGDVDRWEVPTDFFWGDDGDDGDGFLLKIKII
jgi:hypothetical protein